MLSSSLLLLALSLPAGAQTHPFQAQDLVTLKRLSEPAVSPDGKVVVYSLRSTDLAANKGTFDLWSVGVDGTGARQLTSHPSSDTGARWSPDGKTLYFLSTRSGSSQVWMLDPTGGEARPVTSFPLDVSGFLVSPDGSALLLAMEVYPKCTDASAVLECTVKMDEDKAAVQATGRIYEQLFVRHWDTWKDGKRSHLFVWNLDGRTPARDLMAGLDADSPSKPFGDMSEATFTPDSKAVVYTARAVGREEAWSTDFDLYRVPFSGGAAQNLTDDNPAWDTAPTFSPDGKTLAWLAMSRPGFEADRRRIRLMDVATGKVRDLPDWDRSPETLAWSRDGKRLYVTAGNVGQYSIFSVDAASGKVTTVVNDGFNQGVQVTKDRLIFSRDTFNTPADLWSARLDGKDPKQVTFVNALALSQIRFGTPEQFSFTGGKGDTVYGYVVKPPDLKPGDKVPVAFLIHGGPQGSWENHFHYRWNPQIYAAAGYAAVMVDFHGSTGYGQAFQDAIRNDWGGLPYEDLMKGLDAAVARYTWMDKDRVGALGASYGAYMIYWIAGQTDRFKCLVAHNGNIDERMAYYDTEELWFPEWEHGGTPWENPEGYTRHNPIDHVARWTSPTLVVHSANDFRVVDTQGLSAFTALQRRGIPSKLLYFPDESHFVLKPANSLLWHQTVVGWLDQWLKPTPPK